MKCLIICENLVALQCPLRCEGSVTTSAVALSLLLKQIVALSHVLFNVQEAVQHMTSLFEGSLISRMLTAIIPWLCT